MGSNNRTTTMDQTTQRGVHAARSRRNRLVVALLLGTLAFALVATPAPAQGVRGSYVYTLSNFTGPMRQDWSRVVVDRPRREVYALSHNTVHVFSRSGMEVYRFGDDLDLGQITDVAIDERGDVLLLTHRDGRWAIVRCDYRGRPQGRIALNGLPDEWSSFAPNRMVLSGGTLYLASTSGLALVTADLDGNVRRHDDLFRLFDLEDKHRNAAELSGFSVDRDGNVLMTVPVLFSVFVLAADGTLASFGRPGGAPGRFNHVSGIARDARGNLLVVDRHKGAIQIFDRSFRFVAQVAGWGRKPGELVFPQDLGIDEDQRIYVTQASRRGISVFKLTYQ